jgi:exodeoxyribonuclease VII large subunit
LLPKKIGLITSKSGAVIKDIIKILNKRFDNFHLILRNTTVQGDQAAKEICSAIKDLEDYGVDVIIIARGGGSFEDLNCFNDEALAYKISECKIPIISGVGHQTDFTICDFVADVRAATPTHAAEIVILNKNEVLANIDFFRNKMFSTMKRKIHSLKREVHLLSAGRLLKWPRAIINELWQYHDTLSESLINHIMLVIGKTRRSFEVMKSKINPLILKRKILMDENSVERILSLIHEKYKNILRKKRSDADIISERLRNSNPALILKKGYTITRLVKNGNLVKGIEMVNDKDLLVTIVRNGKIFSEVTNKES